MRISDRNRIKELFADTLLKNIFDKAYLIDLESRHCEELNTADLSTANSLSYDDWLISFAEKMFRKDTIAFFPQMDLKQICLSLSEQVPRYIVYCRIEEHGGIQEYRMNISYANEAQTALIILREELTREYPRSLEAIDELSHNNTRFQVLVNHLVVNFIEVDVETGRCHMFATDSTMQACNTLKEQIAWWSENIIVPEERVAYVKEYELEGLVETLRANGGYHRATYTTFSGSQKNSILIISTLVKEVFGRTREYIFAYAQDVTQMKVQETRNKQLVDISQQLLTLSQTEPVTGLYNRAACEKLVEEHLSSASVGTMLLLDIDNFKAFNDQYGHPTGDFVLRYLGKMMQDIFRSNDIVSRWGGDEFVVFMRDVSDIKTITSRIERLRVRLHQCKKEGNPLPVTISVGGRIATAGMSMNDLFDDCDKALYQVKLQGRNNYIIHPDRAKNNILKDEL